MLSYVSAWSMADVTRVQQAIKDLPVDIQRKLDDLLLDVSDPDIDPQVRKDSADFLYTLFASEGA